MHRTVRRVPGAVLAAALLVSTLTACQPAAEPPALGGLRISTAAVIPEITRVTATLSGPVLPQVVYDLSAQADGSWAITIDGLPPGGIRVEVAAFDASGGLRFAGAGDVSVTAGAVAALQIFAQEVSPPPSYGNTPPRIDAIGASALTVGLGGPLSFAVTASDPDAGAVLSYLWTATAGSFTSPSAPASDWVAPTFPGTQTVTVRVTDEKGSSTTASFEVVVADAVPVTGAIALTVQLNRTPQVTDIALSPTRVLPGESTSLVATTADADGEPLDLAWTSTCAGTFSAQTGAATTFTPSTATPYQLCTIYLRADDRHGGVATAWTGLWVEPPPSVGAPLPPPPSTGIVNGGFETGDYTGWFPLSDGQFPGRHAWGIGQAGMILWPGMPVHDFETGTDVFLSSTSILPLSVQPVEGGSSAFLVTEAPGWFFLVQPLVVPTTGGIVSLQLSYGTDFGWVPGSQELSVNVRTFDGLILDTPFRTGLGEPMNQPWREILIDLSPWAGMQVTLDLSLQAWQGASWAQVDAVQLR